MKYFSKLFIAFTLLSGIQVYSQTGDSAPEPSLDGGTINSQFEYIYQKSGNYRADGKRYEVVRTLNLDKLRQNVNDTINAANQKASQLQQVITSQENTIASLNSKLEETTKNLTAVTEEKDSMSLLGAQVSKATYNVTLWTLILGLFLLLLLFIFKFRQSNVLTQEAKSNLADLETEYEDHRRRALEREQRISRQLQDEINKYRKSK
ncbi:MAG: tRNA (guanine-N1)-methyltransferase [Flavobacteriaceae bacterium]|nr:tRNA (guanine-N1)-methyltransferase [Muriicola sp.]NNC63110.1 tRNA (guanine-N1)-methyltransferase [Eudoraea sp.]NNK21603.1 tRNA (guanine-N1)-methyltransferase [Flavobacteriaceae bacterium]MBT8289631.1 tRNA (guanine-N1)-methyltransferase [Muriicola sp.]NNK34822.1 tRNA (guanine-N1)-methyltransferase [Eudoraea sp.]